MSQHFILTDPVWQWGSHWGFPLVEFNYRDFPMIIEDSPDFLEKQVFVGNFVKDCNQQSNRE